MRRVSRHVGMVGRGGSGGGLSLRSRVVLGALAASCVAVTGLMALVSPPGRGMSPGRTLGAVPLMRPSGPMGLESVLSTRQAVEPGRWTAIVIHHSGTPAESPESLDAMHRSASLAGLGYHFVIGNGRRMGDGEVHLGYRWLDQLPGAHVAGPSGPGLNRESIGICLVGDGDRREFTPMQMARLIELVNLLAGELGIESSRVFLHRDVAETTSPGRLFPVEGFAAGIDPSGPRG